MANNLFTLVEFDALTGLQITRELTADELAEREVLAQEANSRLAQLQAKQAARASALAKLAALGLTEEEIAAL